MKNQNCIEIKHAYNLSINYLTRFFSSVGTINRIEKDDSTKYVTIEFSHRTSVDKAFRFEGRILDTHPIRIRKLKANQQTHDQMKQNKQSKNLDNHSKQVLLITNQNNEMEVYAESKYLNQKSIWSIICQTFKVIKNLCEQERKILQLLAWSVLYLKIVQIKYLHKFKINMHANYIQIELQKLLSNRLNRLIVGTSVLVTEAQQNLQIEVSNGIQILLLKIGYPNIEEDESKIHCSSYSVKVQQSLFKFNEQIGNIFQSLQSNSLILNQQENKYFIDDIVGNETQFKVQSQKSNSNFNGIIENIGARDIFYELVNYQKPNTLILVNKQKNNTPIIICSTIRILNCDKRRIEQLYFCNYFEAQIWQTPSKTYQIVYKNKIEALLFETHNLIFQRSQFSLEQVYKNYSTYAQNISKTDKVKVFYLQKSIQNTNREFQKIMDEKDIEFYDESIVESSVEKDYEKQKQPDKLLLKIILIQEKSNQISEMNRLKLQHYLINYLNQLIIGKGLIIASLEMAQKLAANIIQREQQHRLFEFAHKKYEKYIGNELWRLYNRQKQRKIKSIVDYLQIKK